MRSPHRSRIVCAATTALSALALCFALGLPGKAQAREGGPFGLGVMIGDPTGLSFKYHLGARNAVDGGVGYGWRGRWFHTHVDYLFQFPQRWGGGDWLPYVGAGGKLIVWNDHYHGRGYYYYDHDWYDDDDDVGLGVRVPVGLAWHPRRVPIDVFAELAPTVWVFPGTHFDFDFSIGARFYF